MTNAKKIETLQRLIDEGEGLPVADSDDATFKAWRHDVDRALIRFFGENSPEVGHFKKLTFFYRAIIMALGSDYSADHRRCFNRDMQVALDSLRRYVEELESAGDSGSIGESRYDTAQVCLNGHTISPIAGTHPGRRQQHCSDCGESTLMACPDCDASIHGAVTDTESDYKRPSYCHGCGKPYPWTQRSLEAARELIGDELADDELTEFLKNLDDIAKKTPREAVGTERNRKMIAKLSAGAVSALRDIAVNIVSSGAVEKMFGG